MYPPNDIKPGSFILVKFKVSGKRSSITYKYVASVLREISTGEYEIHCLKSLNREKTEYEYIENDISIIKKTEII